MFKNEFQYTPYGETPLPNESDSTEYEDLNGYFVYINYNNDFFSIIIYNLEVLDQKQYECEIELEELFKKHSTFKKLGSITKIYEFLNDLIVKNNYQIIQNENIIDFYFFLEGINSKNENSKICFKLKANKRKDKDEYIKVLKKSLIKVRQEIKAKELSKSEIKEINHEINEIKLDTDNKNKKTENKLLDFNCDKCPLIPSIILSTNKFNIIEECRCQNGHITNKIELLNYLEKGKKISKCRDNCSCNKKENSSNTLFYCDNCKIIFCQNCSSKEHNEHKTVSSVAMNFYCIKHMKQFSSFCKNCQVNICIDCEEEHKSHKIYNFDILIVFENEFEKKIKKSEKIVNHLNTMINLIDDYREEFIEKLNKVKNVYQIKINLIKNFISQYSQCLRDYLFNYHIIQNLDNLDNFPLNNDKILSKNDTFYEKTQKLLNIFNEINDEKKNRNIKLLKSDRKNETIYSMCYLQQHNSIAFGLDKKINIYNTKFESIASFSELDGKIAYIKELWDGKFLVVDLHKNVKILELNDYKITLYKKIETKDEKNFVGIGINTKYIICGGDQYLSILGKSIIFGYKMMKFLDLEGFISNIVEIDSKSFLVGQSHNKRIIIFSNENYKELYKIENIELRSNNYSISKLSDKYVGIAGSEKNTTKNACLFILSLEAKQICKKFYDNNIESFMVIVPINNYEFTLAGKGKYRDDHSDIVLLSLEPTKDNVDINKISEFKRALCDTLESIISVNNLIVATDSSSNMKIFEIK